MRLASRTTQNILDVAILAFAYWAAFLLRFDGILPLQMWKRLLFTWPYVLTLEVCVLFLFGVPRFSWRHVGLREATRIAWAQATVAAVLVALRFAAGFLQSNWGYILYASIPLGIIAGNATCSFLGIVGMRLIRRIAAERQSAQRLESTPHARVPTLLIGAGQAGAQVAREIEKRPDLGIVSLGFLDDNRQMLGSTIHGLRVLGTIEDLESQAEILGAQQVLVTIAELDPNVLRRILGRCEAARLPAKILPGLYQVIDEQSGLGRLRDVSIEDLLGREAVQLDMELVGRFVSDKRVLVTGAGGSIGSELCRQVARFGPKSLALVERSEFALFTIHQELLRDFPQIQLLPLLCDICDDARLDEVFVDVAPEVVFHAAAHKHVPLMELNPAEAVKNNVFGTKAVADAAHRHQSKEFVLISTDKAVNPTSIMGATKRLAEVYVQALSSKSATKYVTVRFGNVLGSTGSVIPTFKAQIAAGGPVTVTHPDMKRYFMTIPEASQLVMQAAAMGNGGEVFVLDMGEPVRIVDLARDLIRLSGHVSDVDIKIEFTGMRPGEKLFEELGFDAECMQKTIHPKIWIGASRPTTLDSTLTALDRVLTSSTSNSGEGVRLALSAAIPEMIRCSSSSVAFAEVAGASPGRCSSVQATTNGATGTPAIA